MTKPFDWQSFIDDNRPSNHPTASQLQKERQVLFDTRLLPALQTWAMQYRISTIWGSENTTFQKRLDNCALAGATFTLDPSNYSLSWHFASIALWLFALDYYLDYVVVGYLSQQDWPLETKIAYLDDKLAIISSPLYTFGQLTSLDACIAELNADGVSARTLARDCATQEAGVRIPQSTESSSASILQEALNDILHSLFQSLWAFQMMKMNSMATTIAGDVQNGLSDSLQTQVVDTFALTTATHEIAIVMGAMRGEVIACFHFHLQQRQPDLETYLAQSMYSMSLRCVASLPLAFEAANREVWAEWEAATYAGLKVMRLVNDCANILREMAEVKPNSVTISLELLGHAIDPQYTLTSPPLQEAIDSVRNRLNMELVCFNMLIPIDPHEHTALTPLGYSILSCVALVLVLYQHGDFEFV